MNNMNNDKVFEDKLVYYRTCKIFSFDPSIYWFYICIGSRGKGKTCAAWYWVLKRYLKHGEKFVWLRLTDSPIKKAERESGSSLVPSFILRKLGIDDVFLRGASIYVQLKGMKNGKLCGIMDSLSTFYNGKGLDMSAFTNIVFDEINRESGERNTFDVIKGFINQIETIVRMRHLRILMLGNTISDTSEILSLFKFQPKKFGIYKLTRRHAIVEYLDDNDQFKEKRANSMAGVLLKEAKYVSPSFINKAIVYEKTISPYTNNKPVFNFYIGEFMKFGVFEHNPGLMIGESRFNNIPVYKVSPYLNCEGIYNSEAYKDLFDLLSTNQLFFENSMIRNMFIKAMKASKSALL